MKKNEKYISFLITIILLSVFMLISTKVYAQDSILKTSIKQTKTEENQIYVTVSISELENIGEGINAYSAILNFNPEELEFVEIQKQGGWNNPIYNEEMIEEGKIKVVATSNNFIEKTGDVFSIVFNAKQEKESYDINFEEFEVAAKIDGNTVKVQETQKNQEEQLLTNENQLDVQKNTNSDKNIWAIFAIILSCIILLVGILSLGFYLYRKGDMKDENK